MMSSISKGWSWMSWITWIKTEILYSKFPLNVREIWCKKIYKEILSVPFGGAGYMVET